MIDKRHWVVAFGIALVATALMQIPYVLGYALAPEKVVYTGLLINTEDYSYHAIMLQGYQGAWQYHIQYTTEPHTPVFIYGFYLSLGQLARTLGISIIAMWHASRIISSLTLFMATYGFIVNFLQEPSERWTAYLLAIFGSGFDWTLFPWERFEPTASTPLDFRMPEVHLFFTALTYPHITLGIATVLACFWLWLNRRARIDWRDTLLLAIAILLVSIIYPFLIFLLSGVLGSSWILDSIRAKTILWREAFALAAAFAASAPLNLYYAFVLQTNPVFRLWNDQAATLSPNFLHYLLAYGMMLALGLPMLGREARGKFGFLWLWSVMVAFLLYAPLGAQRRFVQGVQVPLAILASAGLYRSIFPWVKSADWFKRLLARPNYTASGMLRFAVVLLLLTLSAGNIVVLLKLCALTAFEQPAVFFVPRAEVAAIDWLGANMPRENAVLASYWTSGFIPARSGNLVFAGQRYETNRFEEKRVFVEKFFDVRTEDAFRRGLLSQYGIVFLFWGDQERALGNYDPAGSDFLDRIYGRDGINIYRVRVGAN